MSRLVDPGIPMPPRISADHGHPRSRPARRAGRCARRSPSCSRWRAAASSSPTTRPSTSACSIARSCASTARASACACSTRSASRGACWPGGIARFDLASVSERFDVTVRPCHRALPDALATGEVLLALIGLAQERGAETAEDVMALAMAAPRRARPRRHLATGLPTGPGRLRHARPPRAGALRRQGRRPAHARALVLRRRAGSRRASRARSRRSSASTRRPRAPSSRPRSASSS